MALITSGLCALQADLRQGEPWLTAAIPMENPCCSCKLTRPACGKIVRTTFPIEAEVRPPPCCLQG